MKLSARNLLKGKVVSVEQGMITAKVMLDVGGGTIITSIISKESVADLSIKVGDAAYAVIKSTEVMIAKD
jgi:molybdopterin-binding protein